MKSAAANPQSVPSLRRAIPNPSSSGLSPEWEARRRELLDEEARNQGAPTQAEIDLAREEADIDPLIVQHGQWLRVLSVRQSGVMGDLVELTIRVLADGSLDPREVQRALRRHFGDRMKGPGKADTFEQ